MKTICGARIGALFFLALLLAAAAKTGGAQELRVAIRGGSIVLRHYPSAGGNPGNGKLILASGDGGWRGFEKKMARTMASWGYDVYGLNTRQYLKDFTHKSALSETQAAEDFGVIATAVSGTGGGRVTMMGWSAGAALAVLAGARQQNKNLLEGVVAVSLPKQGELGWRWTNTFAFLPFVKWGGPFFSCVDYVPQIAPLPLLLIQSSRDRWVPDEDRKELFQVAIRPRRRVLLRAGGHSFPGARAEFFEELRKGLRWMDRRERQ